MTPPSFQASSRSLGHQDDRRATIAQTVSCARSVARGVLLASLLGAGALGAGIGLLATSGWLISRAAQHPPESALALAIVAVQFFGLSKGLFRYAQRLVGHDAALRGLSDLRLRVYRRLEPLAPAGLPAFRSGELIARFVHDVDSIQDLVVRVIVPALIAIFVGVATVALVWSILPAAGLILLIALVLAATVVPWLTGTLARRAEVKHASVRGELTGAVVDLVRGAPELTAYGAVERELERARAIDERLGRIARDAGRTAGVGQGLATGLPGLAMVGALLVGVSAVRGGRLDVVLLAVIAIVPLAAFELAASLPVATQTLQRVRPSLWRAGQVLGADPVVVEPFEPSPIPSAPYTLSVHGLRCRYRDGGPWALDGLDLDLTPGRRVALVGRSGAGKSTLAQVLLRLIPYQQGSVTLNGVEIADLDGDDCRRVIGMLSQDAHIFNATVEANLRLARREATDDQLRDALARARLRQWTDDLPAGLATEVGEYGGRLSGGQRQRLAAARALLSGFPVLVLDEPGEHLDTATGDALVADLLEADPTRSILLITHRLAGLDAVDEVIVLEAGRAVQRGTHAELLSSEGPYAQMWQREAGS